MSEQFEPINFEDISSPFYEEFVGNRLPEELDIESRAQILETVKSQMLAAGCCVIPGTDRFTVVGNILHDSGFLAPISASSMHSGRLNIIDSPEFLDITLTEIGFTLSPEATFEAVIEVGNDLQDRIVQENQRILSAFYTSES